MISALRRLAEFEYSRFSSRAPGFSRNGLETAVTSILILLTGAFYLHYRENTSLEMLFTLGAVLASGLMLIFSSVHMLSTWAQPQREWWLSLPYPRLTLVKAKVIGLSILGVRITGLIVLACMLFYGITVAAGMRDPQSIGQFLSLAGASLLLTVAFIPVAIVLGLAVATMYSGWARWLLIPYVIIVQSPIAIIGLLLDPVEIINMGYLSPVQMLKYTLGVVLFGWPFAYILMRVIASVGMRNLADVRLRIKSSTASKRVERENAKVNETLTSRSSFIALYTLERSRFRYYGSILAIRIVKFTLLFLIAVGSFFSSSHPTAILEMLQVLYLFPLIAGSFYSMNIGVTDLKNLQWWLGYPVSRGQKLLSKVAAVWVTVTRVNVMLTLAAWIGLGAGVILGRLEWQAVGNIGIWNAYSIVVFTTMLTVMVGLLQSAYYFMKSLIMTLIFVFPLYLLVGFQSFFINKYLYPETFESVLQVPAWSSLWLLMAVGIPLAVLSLRIGARHIHVVLGTDGKSPLWNSKDSA